jgi:hypothetical protein
MDEKSGSLHMGRQGVQPGKDIRQVMSRSWMQAKRKRAFYRALRAGNLAAELEMHMRLMNQRMARQMFGAPCDSYRR